MDGYVEGGEAKVMDDGREAVLPDALAECFTRSRRWTKWPKRDWSSNSDLCYIGPLLVLCLEGGILEDAVLHSVGPSIEKIHFCIHIPL